MTAATLATIVFIVVLPSMLVLVGAMQGGASAAPFNMAATTALVLGTVIHMWAHMRE